MRTVRTKEARPTVAEREVENQRRWAADRVQARRAARRALHLRAGEEVVVAWSERVERVWLVWVLVRAVDGTLRRVALRDRALSNVMREHVEVVDVAQRSLRAAVLRTIYRD